MGMYDSVEVLYKLPLPENPMGYTGSDNFQTKDLENCLSIYQINENGELFKEERETEWVEGDPNSKTIFGKMGHAKTIKAWWEKVNYHGVLSIYDYRQTSGDYDYWIEYKLTYSSGRIDSVEISQFECHSNKKRKEQDEEFKIRMQKRNVFINSKMYRYFFKHTNRLVYFTFDKINKLTSRISIALMKMRHFLTV